MIIMNEKWNIRISEINRIIQDYPINRQNSIKERMLEYIKTDDFQHRHEVNELEALILAHIRLEAASYIYNETGYWLDSIYIRE